DTRVGCVSSVAVLRFSGTEIDRFGASLELTSLVADDDDASRVFFVAG
ncbi:unnamed protein product, partial [Rotaria socialis]